MESKILEIITKRRSIRDYSPREVEEEKLQLILESARLAPSSCNSQPWHFVVVRDREKIKKISTCVPVGEKVIGYYASNSFISKAPVIIAACANPHIITHSTAKLIGIDCLMLDMGIAVEHLVLTATELGLGTCWLGYFSEKKIKEILGIPRGTRVTILLSLGYPADSENMKEQKRRELREIYSVDTYKK